ncbi:hypothetical protein HGRIS_001510 [Hohenbuehelia grisea]|uniref:Uncharacterized protein n=1 Tax=Hohenbuehelia grisea TaxID=104357 RepID=A0ABR3JRN6_9AGAR
MDVVKAVETYVTRLVSTPSVMKVLLLYSHTTPIVSLASTQSTPLSFQVYLTDRIDNKKRDRMPHMKCVCFLQASEDSLEAMEAELREPKYWRISPSFRIGWQCSFATCRLQQCS